MVKTEAAFQEFLEEKVKPEGDRAQPDFSNALFHDYGKVEHPASNPVRAEDDDLPSDFLEPLSPEGEEQDDDVSSSCVPPSSTECGFHSDNNSKPQAGRQFWKAGDYDRGADVKPVNTSGGMDHVRVHPRFLHSNATSHKWVLGAVAELLDNALDEVIHGATFVNIDTLSKQGKGSHMLLIEDNGGGMDPERMRHCMSLGYSVKSKMTNVIGQYGNGFKTSTMRLGADVIVFSCSAGRGGRISTGSIGLLSYTFLRKTMQQDIVVPMVDFEIQAGGLQKLIKGSIHDWNKNMETIIQWSPFSTENELLDQLNSIGKQGTRIIVYNLWENDQGELELDFDKDPTDIQVRGVNRDPRCTAMAERLPNSKHFLTYRHSLRSYASILYLRLPKKFKMILRGLEIKHHCIVDDLMFTQKHIYKPHGGSNPEEEQEFTNQPDSLEMKADVTIGFVKDAKEHVDVQGFNVYHKNRLIKPFWRIWNSASSQGRGIIGVLEANFVEPAHDKQGFERTTVLARLEARLLRMQKTYWSTHCHKVGYVNKHSKQKEGKEVSDAATLKSTPAVLKVAPLPPPVPPEHKWAQNARPLRQSLKVFTKDSLQREKIYRQSQSVLGKTLDSGKVENVASKVLSRVSVPPMPRNPICEMSERVNTSNPGPVSFSEDTCGQAQTPSKSHFPSNPEPASSSKDSCQARTPVTFIPDVENMDQSSRKRKVPMFQDETFEDCSALGNPASDGHSEKVRSIESRHVDTQEKVKATRREPCDKPHNQAPPVVTQEKMKGTRIESCEMLPSQASPVVSQEKMTTARSESCDMPQTQAVDESSAKVKMLESQLVDMQEKMSAMRKKMEEAMEERDSLRKELEEERKQAEWNDSELRTKLRDMVLRLKELEAPKSMLQLAKDQGYKVTSQCLEAELPRISSSFCKWTETSKDQGYEATSQ